MVSDDDISRRRMGEAIAGDGLPVLATDGRRAFELVTVEQFDVVVTDLSLDHDLSGLDLLAKARRHLVNVQVIVCANTESLKTCIEAMQRGALAYIPIPVNLVELRAHVARALERSRLEASNKDLRQALDEKFGFDGIIGTSPVMRQVFDKVRSAASTDATVLILGENGTGKELIARCLHLNSPRRDGPFVALNCAAIADSLLESELFGHEKGAFTGAATARQGKFEAANLGTLYLDEVGDMPMATQIKLLRVLEAREITRVGSNDPIGVNIRLVSSTNRDLDELVRTGEFREDLYHRLKVVTVSLPALRQRRSDIPLLVHHFLSDLSKHHRKVIEGISPDALRRLQYHPWPGNVRQLRNTIETMVVLGHGPILEETAIPEDIADSPATPDSVSSLAGHTLEELERLLIEQTLDLTDGNREEAARLMNMGERTLYRKINKFGLGKRSQSARQRAIDAGEDPDALPD